MDIEITAEEAARAIADGVEAATGLRCKAYTSDLGDAVVMCDFTHAITRITPLFSVMDATPIAGPFVGDTAEIPLEIRSVEELREAAHAIDEAIAHAIGAALEIRRS